MTLDENLQSMYKLGLTNCAQYNEVKLMNFNKVIKTGIMFKSLIKSYGKVIGIHFICNSLLS